jgi:hypothetical protein
MWRPRSIERLTPASSAGEIQIAPAAAFGTRSPAGGRGSATHVSPRSEERRSRPPMATKTSSPENAAETAMEPAGGGSGAADTQVRPPFNDR